MIKLRSLYNEIKVTGGPTPEMIFELDDKVFENVSTDGNEKHFWKKYKDIYLDLGWDYNFLLKDLKRIPQNDLNIIYKKLLALKQEIENQNLKEIKIINPNQITSKLVNDLFVELSNKLAPDNDNEIWNLVMKYLGNNAFFSGFDEDDLDFITKENLILFYKDLLKIKTKQTVDEFKTKF